MAERKKLEYKPWVNPVPESKDFPHNYNFHLIDDIDTLKKVLEHRTSMMALDTETTGLNHEDIFMVGYSFTLDGKNAYYVPVCHEEGGLGEESVELIYKKMVEAQVVFMFNMRYDVRVFEWRFFKELNDTISRSNVSEEQKQIERDKLLSKQFIKYDMSRVNVIDVQAMVYLVDTNVKYPSLKKSEAHYLGWRGDSFEETLGDVSNFYYLKPQEAYFYAGTDALGTYLLGIKVFPFLKSAKQSGQLDVKSLQPLTRFEDELTLIDTDKLKEYSDELSNSIKEIQERCYAIAGEEYNLGSPVDNNRVLSRLNIHTGVTTKRGMSTSKDSIKSCLGSLSKDDPARQLLQDLVDYASLTKQKSSYVDNVIEMCEENKNHKNRLRFSYKTTEVSSGRFASGGDKKNRFFGALNIQNITKPHVAMHYCTPYSEVQKNEPILAKALEEAGTLEECRVALEYTSNQYKNFEKYVSVDSIKEIRQIAPYQSRYCYKILDWVFSDFPFMYDNIDDTIVEAFDQHLNIRSAFLPDKDHYFVSIDFSAEELRIPTLITKEPIWLEAFMHNKDIHKQTAVRYMGRGKLY